MADTFNKEAAPGISAERIIGKIEGNSSDPVILFFGGIHGNEPVGIYSLQKVFDDLKRKKQAVKGSVYGIAGNLPALLQGVRFLEKDLNRIWTEDKLKKLLASKSSELSADEQEAQIIYRLISGLMEKHSGPFYFIDFHTTSSKTIPFITISDSLINRKFSMLFPVPVVLGIEEHLEGALLSYINRLGYVALAFESGQHNEKEAVKNTLSFIYLTLVFCDCIKEEEVPQFKDYVTNLREAASGKNKIYEVTGSYKIQSGEKFKMLPGFGNFETITKGTPLAKSNGKPVKADRNAVLFMPLYQEQGAEGFFMIRRIPKFFLALSAWLRNTRSDAALTFLPGVSWDTPAKKALRVNLRTARFLTRPFFHLLGYRNWQLDKNHIRMRNRERSAKTKIYKGTSWYR